MENKTLFETNAEVASTVAQYLVDFECDVVSLIHIPDKKMEYYFVSEEYRNLPQLEVLDFEEHRIDVAMNLFEEEERDYYLERTDLKTICKELTTKKKYIFRCKRIQNGEIHHKLYAYVYYPENYDVLMFFIKDISYQVTLEEAQIARLNDAMSRVEEESQAKAHFLSNMSHDMRTPMNAVINLTELCMERMDDQEFLEDSLKKIRQSGQFMLNLINDCLDMQKIESGKAELHPEVYEYENFVAYVQSVFEPLCREKKITLKMPLYIETYILYIDKLRIHQIFLNLISNAIYYTDEGGQIEIDIKLLSVQGNEAIYQFIVKDNGEGMSEAFQTRMFEPFAQERKKKEKNRGTGLGLPIALKTVKLLGGSIDVKSELGIGTEFIVTLPCTIATEAQIAAVHGKHHTEDKVVSLQGKKVLIAEDQPLNRDILQCILEGEGLKVDAVENGKLCVDQLEQSDEYEYDGVILDIRMPVMDGLEAAKAIRRSSRTYLQNMPLIALSANAFVEDMEVAKAAGMDAYVVKPFSRDDLRHVLEIRLN